jgi:hypothetical protein
MMYKYLWFKIQPFDTDVTGSVWEVRTVKDNSLLGLVKWHKGWGQYAYVTNKTTTLNIHYLTEIAVFCETETETENLREPF